MAVVEFVRKFGDKKIPPLYLVLLLQQILFNFLLESLVFLF